MNDRCVFPVGFCINVDDPRVSACAPGAEIRGARVTTAPFSAAVMDAADALEALSGKVYCMLDGAIVRTKANRRSTVKAQDL